ncbi:MAG TPA: MaoC/PaaZ C-terminal domain-containing protein [Polyangiaceae bacterium]|jgi:acyl dehydratase
MSALLHLASQGPTLRALGGVAFASLSSRPAGTAPALPAAWIEAIVPPRPEALIRDYIRHVGGDPGWYKGTLPPHLFPQWSFPFAARALAHLPYPTTKIINAGCRIEMRAPLSAKEPLHVRVRLESVDDDGKRALIVQRVVTGTAKVPEAIVAEMRTMVPLAKREKEKGPAKARPSVPLDAREIAFLKISRTAGRDFAALTGDVNPIHWFAPAAKAAGFRGCILHGFSSLARTVETLNRRVFAGDVRALAAIDVRFTRPLVLPARVGVYVASDKRVLLGDAPGGGAYLEGFYEARGSAAGDH